MLDRPSFDSYVFVFRVTVLLYICMCMVLYCGGAWFCGGRHDSALPTQITDGACVRPFVKPRAAVFVYMLIITPISWCGNNALAVCKAATAPVSGVPRVHACVRVSCVRTRTDCDVRTYMYT